MFQLLREREHTQSVSYLYTKSRTTPREVTEVSLFSLPTSRERVGGSGWGRRAAMPLPAPCPGKELRSQRREIWRRKRIGSQWL